MKELVDSYITWLKDNITIKSVGEYSCISTPFLDMHNDCIQFYIKKLDNDEYYLTDDGYTLDDLESCGFTFNTVKRKELLRNILLNYHLDIEDNSITATVSKEDFPYRKHFYIQGILAINDLYSTNKNNVSSMFVEDVSNFLDNNEISYSSDIKLSGKSGYDHNIDYVLAGLKKKKIPEKYIKIINSPSKSSTQSILFAWDDIRKARTMDNLMFVILNDSDHKINSDIIKAYTAYDIIPLKWTDKDTILKSLKAAI